MTTKDRKASSVSRIFIETFLNLGLPTKLHSDQWKCFKAEIIMELCKHMRLKRQDQRIIIQKVTV